MQTLLKQYDIDILTIDLSEDLYVLWFKTGVENSTQKCVCVCVSVCLSICVFVLCVWRESCQVAVSYKVF